jgi:hypothetical protein
MERAYLYTCNKNHDIENNIGEIEIPEFTMEHVQLIDEKYKLHYSRVNEIEYTEPSEEFGNNNNVNKLTSIFELNELFIEHEHSIELLTCKVNEYNSIDKSNKIQMYFQEILPIILVDEDNLISVLEIFTHM